MNELQNIDGFNAKVYGTVENPLFLAKDIAEVIEHSRASEMLKMVDDDEKLMQPILAPGHLLTLYTSCLLTFVWALIWASDIRLDLVDSYKLTESIVSDFDYFEWYYTWMTLNVLTRQTTSF